MDDLFDHIVWAFKYGTLKPIYPIILKGLLNWDFPIGSNHFRKNSLYMKRCQKVIIISQMNTPTSMYTCWFIENRQEKYCELLIHGKRWLRSQSLLSNKIFCSNILSQGYQYALDLCLFNEILLDQITKTVEMGKTFPE